GRRRRLGEPWPPQQGADAVRLRSRRRAGPRVRSPRRGDPEPARARGGAAAVTMQVHLIDGTFELFRAFFGAPSAVIAGREVGAGRALVRGFGALLRSG